MSTITTTENLALFAVSKANRQTMAAEIVEAINEGQLNPLQIHYHVKSMEDFIKQLTSNETYKNALLDEASKHGKSFEYNASKMEIKEVGAKYDFTKCGDTIWNALEGEINELKNKQKEREAFLKSIPMSGIDLIDPESGEVAKVYPPSKSSITSVTVTLK